MNSQRESSWDLLIQFGALSLLGLAIVVFFWMNGSHPKNVTTQAIRIPTITVVANPPIPSVTAISTRGHTTPPNWTNEKVCTLQIEWSSGKTQEFPAYLVQTPKPRYYLVTLASFANKSDWETIGQVQYRRGTAPLFPVERKPRYVGAWTEDNPPNLQQKPDLSEDLVYWEVSGNVSETLSLAVEVTPRSPVWILTLPVAEKLQWLRGEVLEATENAVYVKPLERYDSEKVVGAIVVNEKGEIISMCQGGDFAVTGSSSMGILKKLR